MTAHRQTADALAAARDAAVHSNSPEGLSLSRRLEEVRRAVDAGRANVAPAYQYARSLIDLHDVDEVARDRIVAALEHGTAGVGKHTP